MTWNQKVYESVPVQNGFLWDCPGCGQRHLQRCVPVNDPEVLEDIKEQAKEAGAEGFFDEGGEMIPDCAICEKCGARCFFDAVGPDNGEEDE